METRIAHRMSFFIVAIASEPTTEQIHTLQDTGSLASSYMNCLI